MKFQKKRSQPGLESGGVRNLTTCLFRVAKGDEPMKSKHPSSKKRSNHLFSGRLVVGWICFVALVLPLSIMVGCNDYPVQRLVVTSYTEVTDIRSQSSAKSVDILFVIDNSGSMAEEQEKLQRNFEAFINELVNQDINDYQIGVVTTDMSDPSQQGRLQGSPKIINGRTMSKDNVVQAFKRNVVVGTTGTSYEKALDAMRMALSPQMLDKGKPNEGFLRPGSVLAVIFVGDEDDCSNNGKIRENEVDSDVCRIPSSQILKDENGKPLVGNDGKPQQGQMENLIPVSTYFSFLEGLNRTVVIGGIIGNPIVYKNTGDPKQKIKIDPAGGCQKDIECFVGSSEHRCVYVDPKTTQCGGCSVTENGTKFTVAPGFRLFEMIKKFGGDGNWFPICGDDAGFKSALLRFAGLILEGIKFIPLTRDPLANQGILVQIVDQNGTNPTKILEAKPTGVACTGDTQCGGKNVCANNKCYGDGWVLFPAGGSEKTRIRLSGAAQDAIKPGYQVKVIYVAKNQ